jgi:hypothetical protein
MATNITFTNPVGGLRSSFTSNGTATVVVAGGTGVSNLISNSTEVVVSGSINKIVYGTDNVSFWTVKRDANVVGFYCGTGAIDYSALGVPLVQDATANIVTTLTGSNGFIVVEVHKKSHF